MNPLALKHNRSGTRFQDQKRFPQAEIAFKKAISADPTWSVPYYNLGLVYKWQKKWQESLDCNKKAVELNSNDEAAWWNLGIASTALAEWGLARFAWSSYGIKLPPGDGQPMMKLGLIPIRLNPRAASEVVWCDRIDPARGVIKSVPLATSGYRHLDLVLHDGQPRGTRRHMGKDVPVFDAIQLLEASEFSTYEVVVNASFQEDLTVLFDLARERGMEIDNWSALRMLCHACSEGHPHDRHEAQHPTAGPLYRLGIAGKKPDEVEQLLEEWRNKQSDCNVVEFKCVLAGNTGAN